MSSPKITMWQGYRARPSKGQDIEYDPYRRDASLFKITADGDSWIMFRDQEVIDIDCTFPGAYYQDVLGIAILRLESGGTMSITVSRREFEWINSAIRPPLRRFSRK